MKAERTKSHWRNQREIGAIRPKLLGDGAIIFQYTDILNAHALLDAATVKIPHFSSWTRAQTIVKSTQTFLITKEKSLR